MYMRLAFAGAAHLEPEIPLVDEGPAGCEAAFQKKCLGKMGSISAEGRTVFFVSHNMTAIQGLCTRILWLDHGQVVGDDEPSKLIPQYLASAASVIDERAWENLDEAPGNDIVRF